MILAEPVSQAEIELLDYCNELMEYKNELAERINQLGEAVLALNSRIEQIEVYLKDPF